MEQLEDFLKRDAEAQVEEPKAAETPTPEAPQTTEEAEPAVQPEAEAEGRPRVPKGAPGAGQFAPAKGEEAPTGDQATDAPPASEEETGTVPVSALKGERSRRQAAEEQLRALQASIAQPQPIVAPPAPQAPPSPAAETETPPDRWEDPDGYDRWLVDRVTKTAREEAMHAFQYQRLSLSAVEARAKLPDFDEKVTAFGQMLQTNPALLEQLHRAPNPAEFAYNTAKIQLDINQHGGIDGLINARVAEALQAQAPPAPAQPALAVPDTLADAQSSRGSTAAAAGSPPSLSHILSR